MNHHMLNFIQTKEQLETKIEKSAIRKITIARICEILPNTKTRKSVEKEAT